MGSAALTRGFALAMAGPKFQETMDKIKTPEDKRKFATGVRNLEWDTHPSNLGMYSNRLFTNLNQAQSKPVDKPAASPKPEPEKAEPAPQMEGRVATVKRKTPSRGRTIMSPLSEKDPELTYRKKLLGD
jgi:hypothetical protein